MHVGAAAAAPFPPPRCARGPAVVSLDRQVTATSTVAGCKSSRIPLLLATRDKGGPWAGAVMLPVATKRMMAGQVSRAARAPARLARGRQPGNVLKIAAPHIESQAADDDLNARARLALNQLAMEQTGMAPHGHPDNVDAQAAASQQAAPPPHASPLPALRPGDVIAGRVIRAADKGCRVELLDAPGIVG